MNGIENYTDDGDVIGFGNPRDIRFKKLCDRVDQPEEELMTPHSKGRFHVSGPMCFGPYSGEWYIWDSYLGQRVRLETS